jgi:hypothetical protein
MYLNCYRTSNTARESNENPLSQAKPRKTEAIMQSFMLIEKSKDGNDGPYRA